MATKTVSKQNPNRTPDSTFTDSQQGENPLSELLIEVSQILKNFDKKKDIFTAIEVAFKKKQGTLLSTTKNLWYKKYEIEANERTRTERRLTQTLEANKILSAHVARTSSPRRSIVPKENNTSLEEYSPSNSNQTNTPQKLFSQEAETNFEYHAQENDERLQRFSSMEMIQDCSSEKNCPLCQQQLHTVYLDLEQKAEKIAELNGLISKMTHKGQILISQASSLTAENSRLDKLNRDLQETVRMLEQHMAKMVGEHTNSRKSYLAIIEEKRAENLELARRTLQLEELVKEYGKNQVLDSAKTKKASKKGKNENLESSSILVQRLLKEGEIAQKKKMNKQTSPVNEIKEPSRPIILDKILPDPTKSGIFQEDFSKIQGVKLDYRSSADDDTIQKLIQGCVTPQIVEEDEADRTTQVLKRPSSPEDARVHIVGSRRCRPGHSGVNFELREKPSYGCSLI